MVNMGKRKRIPYEFVGLGILVTIILIATLSFAGIGIPLITFQQQFCENEPFNENCICNLGTYKTLNFLPDTRVKYSCFTISEIINQRFWYLECGGTTNMCACTDMERYDTQKEWDRFNFFGVAGYPTYDTLGECQIVQPSDGTCPFADQTQCRGIPNVSPDRTGLEQQICIDQPSVCPQV